MQTWLEICTAKSSENTQESKNWTEVILSKRWLAQTSEKYLRAEFVYEARALSRLLFSLSENTLKSYNCERICSIDLAFWGVLLSCKSNRKMSENFLFLKTFLLKGIFVRSSNFFIALFPICSAAFIAIGNGKPRHVFIGLTLLLSFSIRKLIRVFALKYPEKNRHGIFFKVCLLGNPV